MSVSPSVRPLPRRLSRAAFALTTACGALSPAMAWAQAAPQPALPREGDIRGVRTDGFNPQITERSDLTRVDLRARNTVIDWNGFNIPENGTVDFTNGRLLGGDAAVLNRDVSGNPSQLLGRLTSDSNVAVWVHNANGILVGSKAAFNTGSLVLTTLDIKPEDFVRAGDSYRLAATAGSEQSAITVQNGARIFVRGETRGLVMVAPRIDAEGSFVAEGQDVAFVTAADVTLDYRSGSPLSVTLNRGTAVAGTSQYVRGTVSGNNALFALASQGTLTDSLLRVSAEVTTASAGSRGIVLSAGRPATAVSGVTLGDDVAATGGIAAITVDGPLTTRSDRGDIAASASGAISFGARAETRDFLVVEADGALAMTADLSAGGDIRLRGRGVTLGEEGPVTHQAGKQIRVISNEGDIRGTGALTLRSGVEVDESIVLETGGASAGNIDLGGSSRLIAGDDRRGGLIVRRRDTFNGVSLGAIDARMIFSAAGTGRSTDGLRSAGAIVTGDISVRDRLTIDGGSVATGRLASNGAVEVRSASTATTGAIQSGGDIDVVASGLLGVAGDVIGTGDITLRGAAIALDGTALRGSGAIDLTALDGGITAARGIAIRSSSNRRADGIRLQAAGAQGIVLGEGSSITGGTDRALDVRIFAATDAPLTLGNVTARSLGTLAALDGDAGPGGAFRSSGSLRFGRLDLIDGFTAESTGGDLSVDRIVVTGSGQGIDLRAAGALSVQNDIVASGAIALVSGAALALGSIESRDRGITVTSAGRLQADRLSAATGVTASGTTVRAGDVRGNAGAVRIDATMGDLSLGNTVGRDVALKAGGAARIEGALFATGGTIDVAAGNAITVTGGLTSSGGGTRLVSSGGTIATTGGLTTNGDATFGGTAVTLGGQQNVLGAIGITATAGGILLDGASGMAMTMRATGGGITASGALNSGGTIDLGATGAIATNGGLRSTGGDIRLVSSGDTVSATGGMSAGGNATFSGTGITLGGSQNANGSYAATATAGGIALDGASGRTLTLRADGGGITANGALASNGGALSLAATGAIAASGGVRSTGGGVDLASSGGAVSATGGLASDAAASITGTAVTLGGDHSARAGYSVRATAGGIARGSGATSIRADSDTDGGEGVTLGVAGGAIDLSDTRVTAGGTVRLTTDGAGIMVGAVQAAGLVATGATGRGAAIRTGDLAVGGPVTLRAADAVTTGSIATDDAIVLEGSAIGFGAVRGASLAATATGGAVNGGDVTTTGAVNASGSAIGLGRIDASDGNVVLTAAGPLAATRVNAGGTATITGSSTASDIIVAEGISGRGAVTVRSGRNIFSPSIRSSAGALTVAAPNGRLAGFAPGSGTSLSAGPEQPFSLTVGTDAVLGDVTGGNIAITATAITANRIDGGALPVALRATVGDLRVTGPVTGSEISLTAAGNTLLGSVSATGAVTLGGARALSFDTVSGASITATGGTIGGRALVASGTVEVRGDTIALDRTQGGTVTGAAQGDMAIGSVTGGTVALTAGGRATLGSVSATGAVTLGGAQQLTFETVRGASIVATGAAIGGQALVSPGAVDVRGGTITLDRIEGGSLVASARDTMTIGTVATGGSATLTAATTAGFGTVTAGGALTIDAGGGLVFDRLSGGSVNVAAANGTLRGATMESRGATTLVARAIDIGSTTSGGALSADATAGGLTVRDLVTGGDATLRASGAAGIGGNATVGGGYRVTAGSIALGGGAGVQQRADGAVRLTATGGTIAAAAGTTLASGTASGLAAGAAAIVLDGVGGIELAGTTVRAGSALALRAGSGRAIRLGTVEAGSVGGYDGTGALDRLAHDATFSAGDVTTGRIAVTLGGGDLTTGQVRSSGAASLIAAAGTVRTGELTAGTLEARAGSNLSLGRVAVSGAAVLDGAAIALDGATAGALTIRTAGTLGGPGDGATALRTTAGDLTVDAGTARLATVDSAGAATLRGGSIEVRDRLSAARNLLAEARAALTLRDATAGGDIALKAGGAVQAGDLTANGALNVEGNGVTLGAARAGGALGAKSGGALTLASASGNGIALDAAGIVRAGALSGGPSVTIRAADAELGGAIRGTAVRFATRDPATTALRVGDGTAGDGFRLSAGEVAQVAADTVGFDAGSGALEIGTLALAPTVGRNVELLSTGDVRVTGRVNATGTGRTIRIGGDGANGNAATIHIVATSDAGGRLLLGDTDLDLRGNRIAAGLSTGFLDTLQPGDAGRTQAQALVGNANSALYNPQLGGGFYAPDATALIAARSMTVRFGDYALFQNTAVPGRSSGVTVGGTIGAPVTPALRISSFGNPSSASFAFFGEINGITGASAALLGNPVIDIAPALLPNSRINGCLAGSGAGCLTTIVIQPTLQVFDWDSQTVFGVLQDVSLPFTPIIGGNNEELLTGLPALAPETPQDAAEDAAGQSQQQEQPR